MDAIASQAAADRAAEVEAVIDTPPGHGMRLAALRRSAGRGFQTEAEAQAEWGEAGKVASRALNALERATAPAGSTKAGSSEAARRRAEADARAEADRKTEAAKIGAAAVATARRIGAFK